MTMYVVVKTVEDRDIDNYKVYTEKILFGGTDPKLLEMAVHLLTSLEQSSNVTYDVGELSMMEGADLLKFGDFMDRECISLGS